MLLISPDSMVSRSEQGSYMSSRGRTKGRWWIVPVGIQDNSSVPTEQWYLVGKLAPFIHGDDCECATTARLPIDRQVFGIGLVTRVYIVSDRSSTIARAESLCVELDKEYR